MAIHRNREKVWNVIENREEFHIATMSGRWVTYTLSGHESGQLSDELRKQLNSDIGEIPTYVVFSYNTPIGWNNGKNGKGSWIIPDVKYSNTTTNHQGLLRLHQTDIMPKSVASHIRFLGS